ncbi:hypothetical protein [Pseudomonas sp. PH1b]|uniref:hypothetical protein n=1 Tax=Pseudomonas sp. PH1b TaxID=1397282 RepID=UPI0012FEFC30|nr:hypothetical protein [Pseudomonas sp. PH1b]
MIDITFRTQGIDFTPARPGWFRLQSLRPRGRRQAIWRLPGKKKLATSASDSPGNPVIIGACFSRHLPSADHERIHEH